jgi:hypothetical protein
MSKQTKMRLRLMIIDRRLIISSALAATLILAGWTAPASATDEPAAPAATPVTATKTAAAPATAVNRLAKPRPIVKPRVSRPKVFSLAANATLDCTSGPYCRGYFPLLLGVGF